MSQSLRDQLLLLDRTVTEMIEVARAHPLDPTVTLPESMPKYTRLLDFAGVPVKLIYTHDYDGAKMLCAHLTMADDRGRDLRPEIIRDIRAAFFGEAEVHAFPSALPHVRQFICCAKHLPARLR